VTPGAKILVLGMLALHVIVVMSLYRGSLRAERAARERRRRFRQSLLNRRAP